MIKLTAAKRAWIYRIVTATVPLLVTLGVLSGEVAAQVTGILAAILSVGASSLALANVAPDENA